MRYPSGAPLVLILQAASLCMPNHLVAANIQTGPRAKETLRKSQSGNLLVQSTSTGFLI